MADADADRTDAGYHDPRLAAVYDLFNGWGEDRDHHLALVMAADHVVDLGCGTGMLLAEARRQGHDGRLVGIDPAAAMLELARLEAPDVQWVHGTVVDLVPAGDVDLVVMTGHAFQHLVDDADLDATLAGVAGLLRPGGAFAFETRNPATREWEDWHDTFVEHTDPDHGRVRMHWTIDAVEGELVTFTERFTGDPFPSPVRSTSTLRFRSLDDVVGRLLDHGFTVTHLAGDWDGRPPSVDAPEIIVVAARSGP